MRNRDHESGLDRRTTLISLVGSFVALTTCRAEAEAKVSLGAVHYQTTPKDGQECSHCAPYVAPQICRLVDGYIAATGWCSLSVHNHPSDPRRVIRRSARPGF